MAALGFSDLLSLVQSVVLIGALAVTLYFSHKQVQAQKDDLETRVLADIDEMHKCDVYLGECKPTKFSEISLC